MAAYADIADNRESRTKKARDDLIREAMEEMMACCGKGGLARVFILDGIDFMQSWCFT